MNPDDVLKDYSSAWEVGDRERALSFLADDIVMWHPGRGSLAGEHRGREAVATAMDAVFDRLTGVSVEVDVVDRLLSNDSVALVCHEINVRGDERLERRRVIKYRITDAKISEIEIFEANQYEVDEFLR